VVGCLFATLLSNRYGLLRPLLVTLAFMAIIVGMLANGITDTNILISAFSFNFLWIFIDVYQMSTIANVDNKGRFASLMPGAQGLGQWIGPNAAATILSINLGYSGVFVMCAAAALVAMSLYLFMYFRFRRTIPEFAYAT
jgi:predicted MFS family arabinose efflux permease